MMRGNEEDDLDMPIYTSRSPLEKACRVPACTPANSHKHT